MSLANILHHAGYSNDASIVLATSLTASGDKRINYFTLGNIFAVSTSSKAIDYVIFAATVCFNRIQNSRYSGKWKHFYFPVSINLRSS